jgi:ribonuclease HI
MAKRSRRPPEPRAYILSEEACDEVRGLLAEHVANDWEMVLIGDGSGTGWQGGCGWASVSVVRRPSRRLPGEIDWVGHLWQGGMNAGTSNVAELMAYVAPLLWYQTTFDDLRERHVHIFSDSQYVVGSADPAKRRRQNGVLIQAFHHLRGAGLCLHWHWMKRNTTRLHRLMDDASRRARLQVEAGALRRKPS